MYGDRYPLASDLYPSHQNEEITLQFLEQNAIHGFICADSSLSSQIIEEFNNIVGCSDVIAQYLQKLKKISVQQRWSLRSIAG